jgi:hypothetical protein
MAWSGEIGGAQLGFRLAFTAGLLDVFLGFSLIGVYGFMLLPSAVLVICGAVLVALSRFRVIGSSFVLVFSLVWWLTFMSNYSTETLVTNISQANATTLGIMSYVNLCLGATGGVLGLLKR